MHKSTEHLPGCTAGVVRVAPAGAVEAQQGVVSVIHGFESSVNEYQHLHCFVINGVFVLDS